MAEIQLQTPINYKDISVPFGLLSWKAGDHICFSIDYRTLPGGTNIDSTSTVTTPNIPINTAFYTEDGRVIYFNGSTLVDPNKVYTGKPKLIWQIW